MSTVPEQRLAIYVEPRPADVLAIEPGPPHAGPNPLHYKVTFQFGNGADDDDDGAAQWAARVKILPKADELDV